MSCPDREDIERSLDGAPAGDGAAPVEAHLDACQHCHDDSDEIQALDTALAAGLMEQNPRAARVPPRLVARLVESGERELERRAEARAALRARAAATVRRASAKLRVFRRGRPGRPLATGAGRPPRAWLVAGSVAAVALFTVALGFATTTAKPERREAPKPAGGSEVARATPRAAAVPALAQPAPASAHMPRPFTSEAEVEPEPMAAVAARPIEGAPRFENENEYENEGRKVAEVLLPGEADPERPGEAKVEPTERATTFAAALPEPAPRAFRLHFVRGDLRAIREGKEVRVPGPRFEGRPGDALRAEGQGAAIAFGRGIEMTLAGGSEIRLLPEPEGDGFVVALGGETPDKGALLAEVPPDVPGSALRVRTRLSEVETAGGRIAVVAGGALVQVLSGEAALVSGPARERLSRGDAAAVLAPGRVVRRRLDERDERTRQFAKQVRIRPHLAFAESFEDRPAAALDGALVPGGRPGGGARALDAVPTRATGEPYALRLALRRPALFRARAGTELRFAYRFEAPATEAGASGPSPISVVLVDEAGRERRHTIVRPALSRWAQASVALDELDPAPQAGDSFVAIELRAGRPGDETRLRVDDVQIIERH